jgi:hypothetical protein
MVAGGTDHTALACHSAISISKSVVEFNPCFLLFRIPVADIHAVRRSTVEELRL